MTNKKGLSDVVTTVLIVLLTIVAVAILWGFLQPLFTKSGEKVTQADACLNTNVEVTSCTASAGTYSIVVEKKSGAAELGGMKVIFEDPTSGAKTVKETASVPAEYGSVTYTATGTTWTENPLQTINFDAKSVALAVGIKSATDGSVKYCDPKPAFTCT